MENEGTVKTQEELDLEKWIADETEKERLAKEVGGATEGETPDPIQTEEEQEPEVTEEPETQEGEKQAPDGDDGGFQGIAPASFMGDEGGGELPPEPEAPPVVVADEPLDLNEVLRAQMIVADVKATQEELLNKNPSIQINATTGLISNDGGRLMEMRDFYNIKGNTGVPYKKEFQIPIAFKASPSSMVNLALDQIDMMVKAGYTFVRVSTNETVNSRNVAKFIANWTK